MTIARRLRIGHTIAFTLLGGLAANTEAASIAISPLRLDIKPGQQMTAMTVSNTGQQPVLVQGQIKVWPDGDQPEGSTSNSGMMLTPPLFKLAPGGKQLVRIGWQQQSPTPAHEQAFRVFLQEVPTQTDSTPGIKVALRLSVPLFAQPSSPETHKMDWQWQADSAEGVLQLHNYGNRHERISHLKIIDATQRTVMDGNQLIYILPGQAHTIRLPDNHVSLPLSIDTTSDQGTERHTLTQTTP